MNAIEFVREHGVGYTRDLVARLHSSDIFNLHKGGEVAISDLKELVEAFEFVGAHGNIEIAKKYISIMDGAGTSKHYDKLRKFINLVEQCNAKS